MNKKKIFATILCGVFGLSIASGALVANFAHTEEPTIAAPDATRLYVIPGANWSKDGADIAAYIYGGTTTATWYPLETIEGLDNTNILATPEIANLSAATNVIFGRFADGTNDSKSWGWLNPPMYNRSQGGDYAIKLNIAEHNIYRIDNNAGGNLDDSAWGFTGNWLDFMYDDDLVATTNEIGVKFDEVDFAGESVSWYGYTATNGLQGDQIYAMSGTLALNENGIYVGKVSSAINHIQFHDGNWQIKTDYTELQNFAKYTQADQLPLYTITSTEYGNMWRGSWGGNGSVHAPNTEYARLWYSHGGHYASGYLHTLHYWKDGVDAEVLPTGYVSFGQNDEQYLAYFDVKLEHLFNANIQFKIYDNTTGAFQTSTEVNDGTVYSTGNNAHIYYLYFEGSTGRYSNDRGLNDGVQVTGDQLAKVFEAYYTCKNDADNGFANIETLKTTWHVEGATGLDTATINDYASGDTTYTGERNNSTTVADKFAAMEGQYALTNASSPAFFSSITSDSQTIIIVVIALTAFASIVALVVYSIRRRKQEANR